MDVKSTIKCLCGGTAHIENFTSFRTMITGKPEYRWRFVCNRCNEGRYNLCGHSTKQKAYDHYMKTMEISKEAAKELGVSVSKFLLVSNAEV